MYVLYLDISTNRGNVLTKVAKDAPAPTTTNNDGRPQHINVEAEANNVK
jgi:hypothetical protein